MRAPARLKPVRPEDSRERAEGSAPAAAASEPEDPAPGPLPAPAPQAADEAAGSNGHAAPGTDASPDDEGASRRRRVARRPQKKGIPDGWVIDDEGFVVPGPS